MHNTSKSLNGISTLAEETVNPEKTVGRGILISLVAIGIIFILQTYVATLILPDCQNTNKSTGFFDAAALAAGEGFKFVLLVVNILAVGIANTMAAQTATARMLFSMSRYGILPKIFSKIHPKFKTPYVGAVIIGITWLIIELAIGYFKSNGYKEVPEVFKNAH